MHNLHRISLLLPPGPPTSSATTGVYQTGGRRGFEFGVQLFYCQHLIVLLDRLPAGQYSVVDDSDGCVPVKSKSISWS